MLDAALKYLADLATKAAAPVKLDTGDPRSVAYVIDGTVRVEPKPAAPRGHACGTLTDLVELANRFAAAGSKPAVWYDRDKVVLVIDDDGHRLETATLTLEESDVWRTLRGLAQSKARHDQKAFVRLLRIDLAGTLDPVVLLNPARKVKFGQDSVTTGVVQRQRESLGREITSRVEADGGELPEEVTLSVPVYKTEGERGRYPVRCSVEVDPAEGTFRLLALPDEFERVYGLALGSIRDRLGVLDDGVPVYHGKP